MVNDENDSNNTTKKKRKRSITASKTIEKPPSDLKKAKKKSRKLYNVKPKSPAVFSDCDLDWISSSSNANDSDESSETTIATKPNRTRRKHSVPVKYSEFHLDSLLSTTSSGDSSKQVENGKCKK